MVTLPLARLLPLFLALLAACGSIGDRPAAEATAPSRAAVPSAATTIVQTIGGPHPHWTVCRSDCPAPTPKSPPSAGRTPVAARADGRAPAGDSPAALPPGDESPAGPRTAAVEPSPAAAALPLLGRVTVRFATGSAKLDDAARAQLQKALPQLRRAAELRFAGRTDDTGSVETNNALARTRVLTVIEWVRAPEREVHARWTSSSQGACCYIAPNDSAEGRALNRRVEIELYAAPAGGAPSVRKVSS